MYNDTTVKLSPARRKALEDDLLARYAARDSLAAWIAYRDAGITPADHHLLIIRELESLERGLVPRLMLMLPPGSAKSTYTSVEFPPWFLGRNTQSSIIAASHTLDLAERFGRRARNIVASDAYRKVFAIRIAEDSQAAGKWETSAGGEYFAIGVGGSVTGRRADLGIIDDPTRGREDADSERNRETVWQWYLNDFLTRLKPNGRQILITTRWHEDDLAGRILEREADRWKVVRIPMIADAPDDPLSRTPGQRLWPEWFTDDMIATAQRDTRSWNALYQQNPIPDEGDYFRADWFGEYEEATLPSGLELYGASDYAVSEGHGDYTEHGVFGVDQNANIYVRDWWFDRTTSETWIEEQISLMNRYSTVAWFGEKGVIRRAIEPALIKRMEERRTFCRLEWLPAIADKTAMARNIQARASMGKIFFPKNARWKSHVLGNLLSFPAGRHDDSVDVLSLLGRGLELVADGSSKRRRTTGHDYLRVVGGWMS